MTGNPTKYAQGRRWSHLDKAVLAKSLPARKLTAAQASDATGMSIDELEEIVRRYEQGGPKNLRAATKSLDQETRQQITVVAKYLRNIGSYLHCERLCRRNGIDMNSIDWDAPLFPESGTA